MMNTKTPAQQAQGKAIIQAAIHFVLSVLITALLAAGGAALNAISGGSAIKWQYVGLIALFAFVVSAGNSITAYVRTLHTTLNQVAQDQATPNSQVDVAQAVLSQAEPLLNTFLSVLEDRLKGLIAQYQPQQQAQPNVSVAVKASLSEDTAQRAAVVVPQVPFPAPITPSL